MGSFQKGDRVFQAQYGAGDVLAVDDWYTTVDFDDGVVRTFVTSLRRLQPSSESRPVKPPARRSRKRRSSVAVSGDAEHTA